jgi:hypothetical protein
MSHDRVASCVAFAVALAATAVGACAALGRTAGGSELDLRVLTTLPIASERVGAFGATTACVHGETVWVATPDGLFRLMREGERSYLESTRVLSGIRALAVWQERLFVARTPDGSSAHSVLASVDEGASLVAVDHGLEFCHGIAGDACGYLDATHLEVGAGSLLGNFGRLNVFAWDAEHERWAVLLGERTSFFCYPQAFEMVGRRILAGGECPLDVAYLRGARRPESGEPIPLARLKETRHPPLGNRNVQFIARRAGSSLVFAGLEGGLLKSTDGGRTFRFALRFARGRYPYVSQIAFPARLRREVIVAGSSQAGEPFLAYSLNSGRSWRDLSEALPPAVPRSGASIDFLVERGPGQVLLGVSREDATGFVKDLVLVEWTLPGDPVRRSEGRER